jgi:predicted metal-dependent hydrolase
MTVDLIKKIIRTKRKTLGLQIAPDASLIIRAPERASLETIRKVVSKKLPWILEKQRVVLETYRPSIKKEFVNCEGFLYLGEWYKLFIVKEASTPLVFNGKEFLLWDKYISVAKSLFILWYKTQALDIIGQRAKQYADNAGLRFNQITITDAMKRWGSCSSKGAINFSWRLIMAPVKVVDYVVVHELVHLKEHNHTKKFWQSVQLLIPHYQQAREWLRTNNNLLAF